MKVYAENMRAETQGEMKLQMGMCDCRDYYMVALPLREYRITTDVIEELNTDVFVLLTEHSN